MISNIVNNIESITAEKQNVLTHQQSNLAFEKHKNFHIKLLLKRKIKQKNKLTYQELKAL